MSLSPISISTFFTKKDIRIIWARRMVAMDSSTLQEAQEQLRLERMVRDALLHDCEKWEKAYHLLKVC